MKRYAFVLFCLGLVLNAYPLQAEVYNIDPDHTAVEFKIKHLFSWTKGTFDQFEGKIDYDPEKPESWAASATIQTASVNTRVKPRDEHLRSADFFDALKYPTITFVSTGVSGVELNTAKLNGNLTIHGVTRPVTLDLVIHGIGKDPWGNTRAGFSATTTIRRSDFGLNWNKAVEAGNLLVGEEVIITLEVEGMQ